MAIFPQQYFTKENVLLRTGPPEVRETYASKPVAEKFGGVPKGVYAGFTPGAVGTVLTLSPDAGEGYSLLKVHSEADPAGIDVIVTAPIQMDFSTSAAGDWLPNGVQVIAKANYTNGQPTTASIVPRPRQNPPQAIAKDEVLICELTGSPAGITSVLAAPGTNRTTPLAFAGTDFGLMPAGSMEALAAAVDILNEVAAARVDLENVQHATLKERLDTDLGAEAMAFRLGRELRYLVSNDYAVASGATEAIVSGSFSEVGRVNLPLISLNGGGSESVEGAITDPPDSARNVCLVIDAATGDRLISDATNRIVVFGRLKQDADFPLDGTLTFTNALQQINGTTTKFLLQLKVGDTVQGPDGKFYEIATVPSDSLATITEPYQGVTATSGGLLRRRFRLVFRKFDAGVEADHALGAAQTVRFLFPAFVTVAHADFSGQLPIHATGERPAVPDATTSVPGKVALASAGSPFIGAINLQLGGGPVAGGPFHILNFTGSAGALVELSPGIIDVTQIGPTGPIGPGAGPGPQGPQGNPGPSVTQLTPFHLFSADPLGSSPPVSVSHNVDFGYNITFLSGGMASVFVPAGSFFFGGRDTFTITSISKVSSTQGQIQGTGGGPGTVVASVILYLDAAGSP